MPFPRQLLSDREEIVLDLTPHWWTLSGGFTAIAASVIFGVVALAMDWPDWVKIFAGVLLLIGLVFFAVRFIEWRSTNFVVTTDRCIYRSGVFAKKGIEIPLDRINTVFFNQTIFERLIGAGDLAIESASSEGRQEFSNIRKPHYVQNVIYKEIEAEQDRNFERMGKSVAGSQHHAAPPQPQLSVPEQIEKLSELHARGVLSDEEFHRKKAELLDRM